MFYCLALLRKSLILQHVPGQYIFHEKHHVFHSLKRLGPLYWLPSYLACNLAYNFIHPMRSCCPPRQLVSMISPNIFKNSQSSVIFASVLNLFHAIAPCSTCEKYQPTSFYQRHIVALGSFLWFEVIFLIRWKGWAFWKYHLKISPVSLIDKVRIWIWICFIARII